jgi:hypothetical protein
MNISKNFLLFGVTISLLMGCAKNDVSEAYIEDPKDGTSQIELNNNLIVTYESKLADEQAKYYSADLEGVKAAYAETMSFWENSISSLKSENELLEDTLIYNEEFKTVRGIGVFTQLDESILTEQLQVSSFNNAALETLNKYKDVITDGAILINALPFEEDGDKYTVISVYYSQEKLDSIDFEEAMNDDSGKYLYQNADYVSAHQTINEYLISRGEFDAIPDLFSYYSGITY